MADTLRRLAYDEAVRMINAQASVLDNLRARAGTLISVSSVVTAFLAGQALAKPVLSDGAVTRADIDVWGVIAIAAFVLTALAAVVVLWPYKWRFDLGPSIINTWDPDYEQALLDLATFHDENHDANAVRLRRLFHVFQAGCVLLVLETLAWIIDLNG